MSLTHFIKQPENRGWLKALRPRHSRVSRKIPIPVRVAAKTKNYSLVGTAFDYLLRFEIKRRAPWAEGSYWVADNVARTFASNESDREKPKEKFDADKSDLWMTAQRITDEAHRDCLLYYATTNPTIDLQKQIARHALRLGHVDVIYRAGAGAVGREFFNEPTADDIQDLLDLLAIVPFEKFTNAKPLLLNPHFGESSGYIGGADVDLIVNETMLDIKTTEKTSIGSRILDQLLGYYLLARRERERTGTFPLISQVGFYFARYGYLLTFKTAEWTNHPDFATIEAWFRGKSRCCVTVPRPSPADRSKSFNLFTVPSLPPKSPLAQFAESFFVGVNLLSSKSETLCGKPCGTKELSAEHETGR